MRDVRIRLGMAGAVVGAALFLAACGSSSSSGSSSPAASSSPYSSPTTGSSQPSAASVTITTAKGAMGTYLAGASGRALYLWVADSHGKSACSGACAKVWPPLIAKSMPSVSGGVHASHVGLISRSDGTKQVTYDGHPLYYFVADSSAGSTKGQGNNGFGAKWWLVAPSGSDVTGSVSSFTVSAGSAGSGGSSTAPSAPAPAASSAGGGWS